MTSHPGRWCLLLCWRGGVCIYIYWCKHLRHGWLSQCSHTCSYCYVQRQLKINVFFSRELHTKEGGKKLWFSRLISAENEALISSVTALTSDTGFLLRLSAAELVVRVRYKIARRPGNAHVTSPLGYFWWTHPTKHKSCGPCGNAAVAVSDASGG